IKDISEEVELSKKTPFHAMWTIIKIRSWRIFGHHPACNQYKNHYFSIGPINFCIGCTSIYTALILYTILFFVAPSVFRYNVYVITILPFAGFGLAIIHVFLNFNNKWIKAFFRFTAGFGIGAYIAIIIVVPSWWVRIVLAALLLGGNQFYGLSRGRNKNRNKCPDCPLSQADPPCRPIHNTNVKVRKVYQIIQEELQKSKNRVKTPKSDSSTNSEEILQT
ncbi:MAG: hypothetical protein ACFFDW_12930, partial [Candidatus Thorarchaeota archaeon]